MEILHARIVQKLANDAKKAQKLIFALDTSFFRHCLPVLSFPLQVKIDKKKKLESYAKSKKTSI